MKNSLNSLSKKQEQSDLKVMDIVRNGKLKQNEEACMSMKISLKFILSWRKNKKFSKIWMYAAKKKLILVQKLQSSNTRKQSIYSNKHYYLLLTNISFLEHTAIFIAWEETTTALFSTEISKNLRKISKMWSKLFISWESHTYRSMQT